MWTSEHKQQPRRGGNRPEKRQNVSRSSRISQAVKSREAETVVMKSAAQADSMHSRMNYPSDTHKLAVSARPAKLMRLLVPQAELSFSKIVV